MGELVFYGASDDLIEVEGDAKGCDEYPSEDETFLVSCPDGKQAKVRVQFDGEWAITYAPVDEDIPAPAGGISSDKYTARLVLDVPNGTTVNRLAEPA